MVLRSGPQCFYGVKELRNALQGYADAPAVPPAGAQAQSHRLTVATKNLFNSLERSAAPVVPGAFLQVHTLSTCTGFVVTNFMRSDMFISCDTSVLAAVLPVVSHWIGSV